MNAETAMLTPTSERETTLQGIGCVAQAQGGRPLHPRQGQLRRRHQAARHAVRRLRAQPLWPCAHQVDRQQQGARRCRACIAVLTADDLKPLNLHWMPTLAGDVQAVLADEKVCFQMPGSRVRASPSDRYAAADARRRWSRSTTRSCRRSSIRSRRWQPDAPVLREDIADKNDGRPRPAHASQPHLHLGGGRQGGDRRGVRRRRGDGRRS